MLLDIVLCDRRLGLLHCSDEVVVGTGGSVDAGWEARWWVEAKGEGSVSSPCTASVLHHDLPANNGEDAKQETEEQEGYQKRNAQWRLQQLVRPDIVPTHLLRTRIAGRARRELPFCPRWVGVGNGGLNLRFLKSGSVEGNEKEERREDGREVPGGGAG